MQDPRSEVRVGPDKAESPVELGRPAEKGASKTEDVDPGLGHMRATKFRAERWTHGNRLLWRVQVRILRVFPFTRGLVCAGTIAGHS